MPSEIVVGPILGFRGVKDGNWRTSALVVIKGPVTRQFPGSAQQFIGARNWLSLTFDEKNRIWAEWYVEGQWQPYTKVVHPVGALSS